MFVPDYSSKDLHYLLTLLRVYPVCPNGWASIQMTGIDIYVESQSVGTIWSISLPSCSEEIQTRPLAYSISFALIRRHFQVEKRTFKNSFPKWSPSLVSWV